MTEESNGSSRGRRSKVARLIEKYDLESIGEQMERRWTSEEDRWSLRNLASYFNRHLLESALEEEGV